MKSPQHKLISLIESLEDHATPETYATYRGLKSDLSKAVGAESRLTGQALDKGSGAQTPDAYMKIGDTSSTHEVKLPSSVTDTMGQKKVNISSEGEFSLGGKDTPMTSLAKSMDIIGHIKRALPSGHSFKDEGQIAHQRHGPLRANRGAAAIAAAGQNTDGKNQLTVPLTPDQFREHAKNMSAHEDYLHIEGVAAGIPYHHEHPHAGDADVSKHFAHTALSNMSDEQITKLAPHAIVRAKYGSQTAGYSGEMSVRFGNMDALHDLGSPHKTVASFRHGVINAAGTHDDTGKSKARIFSGHYHNPDGSYHKAGIEAKHAAIAKLHFHGRSHETDTLFSTDDHMTDFMDNHYDPKKVQKHINSIKSAFDSAQQKKLSEACSSWVDKNWTSLTEGVVQYGLKAIARDTNRRAGNIRSHEDAYESDKQDHEINNPDTPYKSYEEWLKSTGTSDDESSSYTNPSAASTGTQPDTAVDPGTEEKSSIEDVFAKAKQVADQALTDQPNNNAGQEMDSPVKVVGNAPPTEQKTDSPEAAQANGMIKKTHESLESIVSDFFKEENFELGLSGMLGKDKPLLRTRADKKKEEAKLAMMLPIMQKMRNESRSTIEKYINNNEPPE